MTISVAKENISPLEDDHSSGEVFKTRLKQSEIRKPVFKTSGFFSASSLGGGPNS